MRFFIPAMTSNHWAEKKHFFHNFCQVQKRKKQRENKEEKRKSRWELRTSRNRFYSLFCSSGICTTPNHTSNRQYWWFGYDCVWTSSTKNWMFFGKSVSVNYMVIGIDSIVSWKTFTQFIDSYVCIFWLIALCVWKERKKGEETWKKVEIE